MAEQDAKRMGRDEIVEKLIARIEAGRAPVPDPRARPILPLEQCPSTAQIAEEYGCSTATAHLVQADLAVGGWVTRRGSSQPLVLPSLVWQVDARAYDRAARSRKDATGRPLTTVEQQAAAAGLAAHSEHHVEGKVPAPVWAADLLDIMPGSPCVHLWVEVSAVVPAPDNKAEEVTWVVLAADTYVPYDTVGTVPQLLRRRGAPGADGDDWTGGVYSVVADHLGFALIRRDTRIYTRQSTPAENERLRWPRRGPVQVLDQVAVDALGRRVVADRHVYPSGTVTFTDRVLLDDRPSPPPPVGVDEVSAS